MKFTYARKGQDPILFEFDADDFTTDEAEAIDEAGGTQWNTFGGWVTLLNGGGFRAWRVALWIMLRKTNPGLGFEEVRPTVGELILQEDSIEPPPEPSQEPAEEVSAEGKSGPGDESTSSP